MTCQMQVTPATAVTVRGRGRLVGVDVKQGTCTWGDCGKALAYERAGLCAMHYQRQRTGRPMDARNGRIPRQCAADGCDKRTRTRDWCANHYRLWKKYGEANHQTWHIPFADRLPDLVDNYGDPEKCWTWRLTVDRGGYGNFYKGKQFFLAHRLVYETLVGPIAEGMHLDHECHDPDVCEFGDARCPHRQCVNPAHLTQKTPRENSHRSNSMSAVNARKTHCIHGHPFKGENLVITSRGTRQCRICIRDAAARRRARTS